MNVVLGIVLTTVFLVLLGLFWVLFAFDCFDLLTPWWFGCLVVACVAWGCLWVDFVCYLVSWACDLIVVCCFNDVCLFVLFVCRLVLFGDTHFATRSICVTLRVALLVSVCLYYSFGFCVL